MHSSPKTLPLQRCRCWWSLTVLVMRGHLELLLRHPPPLLLWNANTQDHPPQHQRQHLQCHLLGNCTSLWLALPIRNSIKGLWMEECADKAWQTSESASCGRRIFWGSSKGLLQITHKLEWHWRWPCLWCSSLRELIFVVLPRLAWDVAFGLQPAIWYLLAIGHTQSFHYTSLTHCRRKDSEE